MKTLIEKTSNKLVDAFLKNKIIPPIPIKFTKKLKKLKNYVNYVKVKYKNQLLVLKQPAQAFL